MTILDTLFESSISAAKERQNAIGLTRIRELAEKAAPVKDFIQALRRPRGAGPALIAEVKRASPSKGIISEDFDHIKIAKAYFENGADCVSVLTEASKFLGELRYLEEISHLPGALPLLQKDFMYEPFQVFEARAHGASAILLIVAYLEEARLTDLYSIARSLGMAALVETHNKEELDTALKLGAGLIGVNNRDLKDFYVRLETSVDLARFVPDTTLLVAESGIKDEADREKLRLAGIDAILVGESLLRAPNLAEAVRRMSA